MAAPPLKSILTYGQQNGKSPEEIAAAVQKWRKDALDEGRTLAKDAPDKYWKGSAQVESEAQLALTGLNEARRQKILTEILPDPEEQKNFIQQVNASKGNLPDNIPPKWQATQDALLKAGDEPLFQGAQGFQAKIAQGSNELGSYEVRQTPDGDYEALITPAGGDKKPLLKRFSVNREKLLTDQLPEWETAANQAAARVKAAQGPSPRDLRGPLASSDETDAFFSRLGGNAETPTLQEGERPSVAAARATDTKFAQVEARRRFLQNAPDATLIQDQLEETLRTDKDFLKTVPENFFEQFAERPARSAYASLQNAGTGVSDLITGTTSSGEKATARQQYIDETAPGYLRSRFETKGDSISDEISSGVESLTTLYGPGAFLKVTGLGNKIAAVGKTAAPLLEASGIPGSGVAAAALQTPAAAAGWSTLFASAYGANYASALQEADAIEATDPERAKKIRSMAQFSSFANAGLEYLTEKVPFGDEARVFSGRGANLLQAATIPVKEGIEEGLGATGQNVVGIAADTGREQEDVLDAAQGGFFGGAPMAGLSLATKALAGRETVIAQLPQTVVGGEVLANVPVNTPIEEVQAIVSDLTEGEQRRQELAALPAEETLSANPPGDDIGISPSPTVEAQQEPDVAPGTSPATDEEIQNESEETSAQSPQTESAGDTLEPLPNESRSESQPSGYISNLDEATRAVDFVNQQKGSQLRVVQAPSGSIARFAEQVASISGRQVVYVEGKSNFDGVQNGNYLIVKAKSPQALRLLVGHELGHSLQNSPGFAAVSEALQNRYTAKFAQYSQRVRQLGYTPEEVESEFMADSIGEAIHDRAFWRSLTQTTDPTVLQKIYDALMGVIDKVTDFARTTLRSNVLGRPNASKTLRDLESARTVIRELIQTATPATPGALRESAPESVSYTTRGRQADGEGGFLELYNVVAPGNPADGTTIGIPEGATPEEVQQAAEAKAAEFALSESRTTPTQQAGVKQPERHEIVSQESLHRIVDPLVSPTKVTESSYETLLDTFKSLRRANGAVKNRIREGVRKEFSERLAGFPANQRETEALILEAQAIQVLLGNAMAAGAEYNSRKGAKNPKRAATIVSEVKKLAFANIVQVPGDAHTAARVLRSSQLEGGDLAALMHDLFDGARRYMEANSPIKQKNVTDIEAAIDRARPAAVREAARVATPGGENYLGRVSRAKGRIRSFIDRYILLRESRSGDALAASRERLLSAMSRLEEDYEGNVELVLELSEDAINRLPPAKRAKALEELAKLVEMDIRMAEEDYHVYGDDRNLNRVAKSFITRTINPTQKQKVQATADLAAMRLAVKNGSLTPEDAAQEFVNAGGDPALRGDLIAAFEVDATRTIHQEELKEEARRARKEYREMITKGNKRAKVEVDSIERIVQNAAKQASDELIASVGEAVAKQEDFVRWLETAAERAAQQSSDALIEEAGEQAAQEDSFQALILREAKKAADAEARSESKRLVKEVGDAIAAEEKFAATVKEQAAAADRQASRDLVKEVGDEIAREEDFVRRITQMAKDADAALKKEANSVFDTRAKLIGPKNKKANTVTQDVIETVENNPEWDVSNHADKVEIIKAILRRRGVDESLIQQTAENSVKAFEAHLEKAAQRAGETLVRQLQRGKVTEQGLFRAIRLHILDPTKTLTESLAALSGWNGLTTKETSDLYDITKKARDIKDPQVRLSLLLKQMRIIYAATGIPPDWRDFVSSYTRASAYSGLGTIWVNTTVAAAAPAVNLIREGFKTFVSNPLHPLEAMADTARALIRAYGSGARRGGLALRTNATLGLSAAKATGGRSDTGEVGVLSVDALERQMDLSLKRIKDSKMPGWRKAWESFLVLATVQGKILWRVIGAIDTVTTAQITEFISEMRLNRNLRRQDLDPVAEWSAFMSAHEAGMRHAVERLGLTDQQASIELMARLQDAYYVYLGDRADVTPFEYREDARREALTMIGNHAERQGVISRVGNGLADFFGHRNFLGLGFVLSGAPIRTIANIAEYTSWYAPGLGLGKMILEYRARKAADDGIGNYHLHAGSNWQFRRRVYESLFGQVLTGGLIALLAAQPDDEEERWFGISTSYPWKPGDAVKFRNNGETPYTMYFGSKAEGGRKYLQFTRGVAEMFTFPSIAAKNYDMTRRGEQSWIEAGVRVAYDSASVGLPVIDSLAKQWNTLQRGNNDRIMETLARKASVLVPGSSLFRSVQKLTTETPAKNSSNYLSSILIPGYAIFADNGDVELRNSLDEPIFADNSVWGKVNKMGLPFGFLPTSAPQDELLAKDFSRMNYAVPPAPAFKSFENQIEGREQELLEKNSVGTVNELFNLRISRRAAMFKELYRNDPNPGDNAKDQRTLEELLETKDMEGYKKRMGAIWQRATRETNLQMGVTEEE
jgi:ribosomal protein L1